jgi:SAM-dependent methyltransferase
MNAAPGLKQGLSILRTHATMFGLWSCVRATAAYLMTPRYDSNEFDAKYGTDTSAPVNATDGRLPGDYVGDAIQYEPTNPATVHHVMRSLSIAYEDFELIDVGCGKGRTILLASDYPFARITGIELSPVTSEIAKRNIATYTSREPETLRCRNIHVLCANAVDFAVPDANVVFFMFNPFVRDVFSRFIEHVHRAAEAHPQRKFLLAYVNPWQCEASLEASGYFSRVAEHQVIPRVWSWSLWRHAR